MSTRLRRTGGVEATTDVHTHHDPARLFKVLTPELIAETEQQTRAARAHQRVSAHERACAARSSTVCRL
eukprot:6652521-Prymnesium_polylepis.1